MSDERADELEERIAALEQLVRRGKRIEPDFLYSPAELAEHLSCGKTNVYDLLQAGHLAVTPIGAGAKGLRIRGADFTAFLDNRREGGPAPKNNFKHLGKYLNR